MKKENTVKYILRLTLTLLLVTTLVAAALAGVNAITAQDRKIAHLIATSGRACVIVANKIDLCPEVETKTLEASLRRGLPQLGFAPVVFISAEQGLNFDGLQAALARVSANRNTEITTGKLNRVLADALELTPPPVVSTCPLKLFYAALAGIRPPKIKLFVNRVDAAADNYLVFLKKQIRKNFSLEGIPLALEVVERPKKIASIRSASPRPGAHRKNKQK